MGFIERFEKLLKAKSLSQKDLADMLEIRRPSISDWKKNKSFPYADVAVKIAKILGVSVEYLITGKDGLSDEERELLGAYNLLNDDGKVAALATVKGLVITYPIVAVAGNAG
jgi:transcriptional regulator with XRE-family HTH domain